MPLTYTISRVVKDDKVADNLFLENTDEESPYKIAVTDQGQPSFFRLYYKFWNGQQLLTFYDLTGKLHAAGAYCLLTKEAYLIARENNGQDTLVVLFDKQQRPLFQEGTQTLNADLTIGCGIEGRYQFIDHTKPVCSIPSPLARFHQSTFGGHLYRTIAGMVLLASLLCLLFLSPASLSLLPLLGKTLGSMAFGLQSIFATALAKTLLATLGGFLALTAPKWLGNLLQLVGIRLLGGVVGRVISGSMCLARLGILAAGFIIGIIPALLLMQCSKKAWDHCAIFLNYSAFLLASLPGLPLLIVCYLGTIVNNIGIVLSGEYLPTQEGPSSSNNTSGSNKPNLSVWNKILLVLNEPIPAIEEPAIIAPLTQFSWARKYDRFCNFFRFTDSYFGNLCYTEARKNFMSNWTGAGSNSHHH